MTDEGNSAPIRPQLCEKENSVCYDCRFFYVVSGEGILFANGEKYEIIENSAIYLPSGSRYRFEFENPNEVKIYVFDFDLTSENSDIKSSIGTSFEKDFDAKKLIKIPDIEEFSSVIVLSANVKIQNNIAAAAELFLLKTAYYQHYASSYLKLSLLSFFDGSRLNKCDFKLAEEVQEYIRLNYRDISLTNEKIAKAFSYHPYYLSRVMKACTNKTLHEYLLDYRLHIAKSHLVTSSLSITEIAQLSGFASYTYFIKTFRERVGTSPLKYRKQKLRAGI